MSVGLMAKAKAPTPDDDRRTNVLNMRGRREWAEWLKRLADHCRVDVSTLVDQALEETARRKGFTEKPPKR